MSPSGGETMVVDHDMTWSPVNTVPSSSAKARWSEAWPGVCSAVSGPMRAPWAIAMSGLKSFAQGLAQPWMGAPVAAFRAGAPAAWSGCVWVSRMRAGRAAAPDFRPRCGRGRGERAVASGGVARVRC